MSNPEQRQEGGAWVMHPEGRLDMAHAGAFREEVQKLLQTGPTRLVLDLGQVSFIDSSGLAALIRGLGLAREAGGDLRIACPTAQASAVLELSTLNQVLPVYSTVEEALADFK
jgi:anti-sigma B factor antagonist